MSKLDILILSYFSKFILKDLKITKIYVNFNLVIFSFYNFLLAA